MVKIAEKGVVDSKDLKILEMMTEDGKVPHKKIASKIKISKESVAYRIKRLERMDILRQCVAKIDMTRFYQNSYLVLFRFSQTSPELQKGRIDFIVASPYVMWVASLSGEYDIVASFLTRDASDLTDFIRSIEEKFSSGMNYELFTYSCEFKNSFKDVFRTAKALPEPADGFMMRSFSPTQLITMDDKDKILLYSLSKNAKMTNSELAGLTGLSEEGVRQRIKSLEKAQVITGYRYLVNIYRMNMEIYHVMLNFNNMTKEKEDEIKMYIQTNPNFYYSARLIGSFNVTICLTARNRFHLQEIMDGLKNRFSDCISKYNSRIMFGEYKHTYLPPACCRDVKGFSNIEKDFEKKYAFTHDAKMAGREI